MEWIKRLYSRLPSNCKHEKCTLKFNNLLIQVLQKYILFLIWVKYSLRNWTFFMLKILISISIYLSIYIRILKTSLGPSSCLLEIPLTTFDKFELNIYQSLQNVNIQNIGQIHTFFLNLSSIPNTIFWIIFIAQTYFK